MFTGAPRQLGETTLQIYGNQYPDGRIERGLLVTSGDEPLSAEEARELAGALFEAAEEMEQLGER